MDRIECSILSVKFAKKCSILLDIQHNTDNIITNNGTIVTNEGSVETNSEEGTITTNEGSIINNEGTIDTNNSSIRNNAGTVNKNEGSGLAESYEAEQNFDNATGDGISSNTGEVSENNGDILINSGQVTTNNGNIVATQSTSQIETNNGNVKNNHGTIEENNGFITSNENDGTIEKNNKSITHNYGIVEENAQIETEDGISLGVINNNYGTVDVNNGKVIANKGTININKECVNYNTGTIVENDCFVGTNHENAKVVINNINDNNGVVSENRGTVEIIINEDKTNDEIESLVNNKVPANSGEVIIKNSDDEVITKYFGISGYNGLTGKDYYRAYLDSIKENETYTLSIPSEYGIDGNITLSKDCTTLEVIGDALETDEDGNYIVPVGTKFKVTGSAEFIGKWYKIITSSGASVEVEKVIHDVSSSDDDELPSQETPAPKNFSSNIPGVEINNWEDVSNVMATKADAITPQPNSDVKLFKLELSKKQLAIPSSVVSSLAASQVDGLHCFIGDGDAITFINNGTLDNYVPTDFSHSDKVTNDMKIINFEKPQAIGATVILSTRIPVKNTHVAIWMLVDGKYELIGVDFSNETGNIAFPISCTGQFVLTY